MTPSERLREAFEGWRRAPWWQHLLAVFAFALLIGLRWWAWTLHPAPLADEIDYVQAFERVAGGRSPYLRHYFYPPALAFAGAWCLELVGPLGTLALLRSANFVGIGVATWIALAWLPGRLSWRWLAGAALLVAAPAVEMGVQWGNLSLAVAGLIVAGLLLWPWRPALAGALLGASVAVKPVAPVAILVLLAHRPAGGGKRHRIAAGVGLALAALLLFAFPYRQEMLELGAKSLEGRSVSVHRIVHVLGLRGAATVVSAVVLLIALWVVRRRDFGPLQLLAVAVTATLAATPLVWGHTLLVCLPLQLAVLVVLVARGDQRRRFEAVFVVLGVAAVQLAQGATGIDDRGMMLQLFGTLPPALAPTLLTLYLVRTTDTI